MSKEAINYLENYQTLKQIADTIRDQNELDIDTLVTLVEQATDAYKKCQTRIETVEKMLGQRMNEE